VVDYLTSKGVSVSRIQSEGYGETRPVAPNNSEANRAKNRRIEFKVKKS
jgi:OOP family OmpA-OmpF porin